MVMTRWILFAAGLLVACSNDNPSNSSTDATGGKRHTGGASSRAGAAGLGGRVGAAGTSADGGTLAVAGNSPIAVGAAAGEPSTGLAGATATGGITGASGATSSAGDTNASIAGAALTAVGGAAAGGAPTGGSSAIGGTSTAVGGAAAGATTTTTGGNLSMGGTVSTGGATTTGGVTMTGGAVSTGGTTIAGGAAGTATGNGGTATGGAPSTGGTPPSTGGAATGGTPSTGGAGNCLIDSVVYPSGTKRSDNECLVCNPANATNGWSLVPDGTICATGQVCHSGTCQPGCWIGSTYHAADTVRPNGPCQACKPATSTTAWTSAPAACGCTGTLQTVQESTGLCVATMVPIPGPTTDTNYSIDSTEVTRNQYAMWLDTTTAATLSAQDVATCSWNTDFAADASCMTSSRICTTDCDNHPQVCVDWCDAYAYCKGIGKRLCGKIGGGPNLHADYASASLSEWYRACSSAGANTYPYGSTYSDTTCNGYEYWGSSITMATLPVGTLTGCHAASPYAGAYDLSGSVMEWEDSCDSTTTGSSALCRVHGGSFNASSAFLACGLAAGDNRNDVNFYVGLRCCSP
jgi:formylglycine-generating enzyme